jgi:hypothetical protein
MKRFLLLLHVEFRMFRTALPIHLIAVFQPALMFVLMTVVMDIATFDMYLVQTGQEVESQLAAAMKSVGSPIGPDYIDPILVNQRPKEYLQVIEIVELAGQPTAVQHFGYIDSNIIKNYRNRLTTAALRLWEEELGEQAVTLVEYPLLPLDVPYFVYFGMALSTLAVGIAAALIGGFTIAQDFENATILEYRLAPAPSALLLAVRLTRLMLTGLISAFLVYLTMGFTSGVWASSLWVPALVISALGLVFGCVGLLAGMMLRSSLPSFVIALTSSFACWLIGGGFGLAAGFSTAFEYVSKVLPNTHAVELMFPYFYYGRQVGSPALSLVVLLVYVLALVALTAFVYQRRVLQATR